jgi:hypothetical protein
MLNRFELESDSIGSVDDGSRFRKAKMIPIRKNEEILFFEGFFCFFCSLDAFLDVEEEMCTVSVF